VRVGMTRVLRGGRHGLSHKHLEGELAQRGRLLDEYPTQEGGSIGEAVGSSGLADCVKGLLDLQSRLFGHRQGTRGGCAYVHRTA
jgi:hypothetical protein